MDDPAQKPNFKREALIYCLIILLTGLIITISHLHLGVLGIFLIVPVACVEAGILGYFFMHLSGKQRTIHLLLLLTIVVFLSLLFWPAWDIIYSPRTPSEYSF